MNPGARAYASTQPAPDMDALVRKHADLVKRIAYHLAGRLPPQVEVEDLMQAGMMGLLEAAQNCATGRGVLKPMPASVSAARCSMHCESSTGRSRGTARLGGQ